MKRMSGKRSASAEVSAAKLCVLYDGWPVTFSPASPAALHLLALLDHLPPEVEALVALPGLTHEQELQQPQPDWLPHFVQVVSDKSSSRLRWEQQTLPALARRHGARLLHLFEPGLPLSSPAPVVFSPCSPIPVENSIPRAAALAARLRYALGQASRASMSALLWPADLPAPESTARIFVLPPVVPKAFELLQAEALPDGLPPRFTLYHHSGDPLGLQRVLAAWVWAGPPLEVDAPLVIAGLSAGEMRRLPEEMQTFGIAGGIQAVSVTTPAALSALYHHAAAQFHPSGAAPWGDALLLAQAVGLATAALETPENAARCGAAAYLSPPFDARAQAAALVTLVFEEALAQALALAARQRAQSWHTTEFGPSLLAAYHAALSGT